MKICIITDKNYLDYTINLIRSINMYNNCTIYVIVNNIQDKSKLKLFNNVKIIDYNNNIFYNKENHIPYISSTTYIRLYLPLILDNTIDKILYLDCDCLVKSNLSNLYNINIQEYLFAAVKDYITMEIIKDYPKFNYTKKIFKNYYNAGVLLLNLKKLREEKYTEFFFNFYNNMPSYMVMADQDILNYCCMDKIYPLDCYYNYFILSIETNHNNQYKYNIDKYTNFYKICKYNNFKELKNDCSIVHFLGDKNKYIKLYKNYCQLLFTKCSI